MKYQDSRQFYESLFDNIVDGLVYCRMVFDNQRKPVDFICEKTNKNFEKVTGLKEVVGKKITELIPEVSTSNRELLEICGRVSSTGESKSFEIYVDSLARWFFISAYSPQKDHFVALFQNITGQKQVEKDLENANTAALNVFEDLQTEKETLARAKAKDEALLESIGEGVVATDQDGKIILVNWMAEQLLGWSAKRITGKLLVESLTILDEKENILPPEKRPIVTALRDGIVTNSSSYFYVRKDGKKLPVSIAVTPVLVDNKIIGAIDVFHDITKEKEIEKLRMDFLSLASHQLRTPLSGTKWLIETMRGEILGEMTEQQKEYLDQIYNLNERMIKLVFDMLNVLRLESGTVTAKKENISIPTLYDELIKTTDAAAKSQGVTVENNAKDSEVVETDIQMLLTILDCFVSNAISYSPPKGKIILGVEEKDDVIIFSVKDSGIGIPKDEQVRMFERFYRASNAKDLRPTGTGLGLNIARTLAEKIGAEISFESEENKGSIFYLYVPKKSNQGKKDKVINSKN